MGNFSPKKFIHLQQGFLILCASCYFFSISSSPAFFYAFHFSLNNYYCTMKEIDQDTLWNIWCVCNLVFPIPTSSHPLALRFHHHVCNCHHKSKTRNRTRKKLRAIYHEKRGKKERYWIEGQQRFPWIKVRLPPEARGGPTAAGK